MSRMSDLIKKQSRLNREYVDQYPEGDNLRKVAETDKLDLDAIVILAKEGYYRQAFQLVEQLDVLVREIIDDDFYTVLRREA